MELRAAFLYARGAVLGEELRGVGACELEVHDRRCAGGAVTSTQGESGEGVDAPPVTLRRERAGAYVATGIELCFVPEAPVSSLPFSLRCGQDLLSGTLRCTAAEDGTLHQWTVELATPNAEDTAAVPPPGFELVLVAHDVSSERPVCLSCTCPLPLRHRGLRVGAAALATATLAVQPLAPPGAFLRTNSGRAQAVCALESIDEYRKVRRVRRRPRRASSAERFLLAGILLCSLSTRPHPV